MLYNINTMADYIAYLDRHTIISIEEYCKQLPDDLHDMIYSELHKSYMKDVNIEIEQY